jgi:hypothetical protein
LTQNSSTSNVISQQSSKMMALEHTLGIKHWRRVFFFVRALKKS